MKDMEWILVGVVVAFAVWKFMPVKGIEQLDVEGAKAKFKDRNVQFIDVRTPGEYRANHRKPFVNMPLSEIGKKAGTLKKDQDVVVICQSGMRSTSASKALKKQGFTRIYNVKGGMNAWR
ncbi:rhodanese-like domain-containing protein [Paenalkalicoccus suaedae]|uniref:Rhodanese-like domain-containing protein n=1 Tax=Paenalkalicoccus suaedae TaxID=2592382 RepID=A0A859FJN4_9BACI|nr:rhodanese-like domain-containing protein [Paenalkalicoccus suaedae]QKS73014.1 rhodanese-like domain-containing protein [Paenalkalicoccus suaedae]